MRECGNAGMRTASVIPSERSESRDLHVPRPRQLRNADDYPDFAEAVATAILSEEVERAVLICGSGVGASVAANKFAGIRAGLCHDTFSARQGVEDDDVNVLCLGARVIGPALAGDVIRAYLGKPKGPEPEGPAR